MSEDKIRVIRLRFLARAACFKSFLLSTYQVGGLLLIKVVRLLVARYSILNHFLLQVVFNIRHSVLGFFPHDVHLRVFASFWSEGYRVAQLLGFFLEHRFGVFLRVLA